MPQTAAANMLFVFVLSLGFSRRSGRWGEVLAAWELCRHDQRDSLPDDKPTVSMLLTRTDCIVTDSRATGSPQKTAPSTHCMTRQSHRSDPFSYSTEVAPAIWSQMFEQNAEFVSVIQCDAHLLRGPACFAKVVVAVHGSAVPAGMQCSRCWVLISDLWTVATLDPLVGGPP